MANKKKLDKGYYKVPDAIHLQENMTSNALIVYIYLCRCSDKNNQCFPSYRDIAEKCFMGERTVERAIKQLINNGLIIKENRKTKRGGKSSNLYTVYHPRTDTHTSQRRIPIRQNDVYPSVTVTDTHTSERRIPSVTVANKGLHNEGLHNEGPHNERATHSRATHAKACESRVEKNPPTLSKESEKRANGKYGQVHLTAIEYDELVSVHGQGKIDQYIAELDEYIASKGERYKDHFATVNRWIRKADEEATRNASRALPVGSKPSKRSKKDWEELERKEREYIIRTAGGDTKDKKNKNGGESE